LLGIIGCNNSVNIRKQAVDFCEAIGGEPLSDKLEDQVSSKVFLSVVPRFPIDMAHD
jgi:hypothetical protein